VSRHRFRILDIELELSGPAEIVDPIAFAYRRFAAAKPVTDAPEPRVVIEHPAPDVVVVDGTPSPVLPGLERQAQIYHALQVALMDAIGSHAVLHAGAMVAPDGGVVILAGPSGHGKSSVTLALIHGGFRFMSDDYAPLDPDRRDIAPYPRAVGIIPGGTAPIPEAFRNASLSPDGVKLMGKTLVDVGRTLGEEAVATGPAPLRHVILLTSDLDAVATPATSLVVGSRLEHASEIDTVFRDTPGVTMLRSDEAGELRRWWLELDPALRPTERLAPILDGDRVAFAEKQWGTRPTFDATPEVTPIRRREAAELLGRELLNRRSGGALLARFGGSVPRLFLEVAGALSEARCSRLQVGNYAATADLIRETVAAR
jgi:hypothetical protein